MTSLLAEHLGARPPHQDVPARELCRGPRRGELRGGLSSEPEARCRQGSARVPARSAGRVGRRRRHLGRLLAHRERAFDGRRFHGPDDGAAHGGTAAACRRQPDRAHSGRARGRREPLRHSRREADDQGSAERAAAQVVEGHDRVRSRVADVRQERRRAGGAQLHARGSGRPDGGARRAVGRRQVDGRQSGAAPVRRDGRRDLDRRPGRARRDAGVAARRHRHRQPGRDAVRRYDPRQYRARQARRHQTRRSMPRRRRRRRTSSFSRSPRATTP